jgi:uncharacterized protein (TIGR00255 family)
MSKPIHSMTGFSSVEGVVAGSRMRVEIKTLNHRFLDLKTRLPRELSSAEIPLRALVQGKFSRGAVDLKVDRIPDHETSPSMAQVNLAVAAHYFEALVTLQKTLGLSDSIRTIDIASMPDVISRTSPELQAEEAWAQLEPLVCKAIERLAEMRAHEGLVLTKLLIEGISEMDARIARLRERRGEWEATVKKKTRERIKTVFEAHPISDSGLQAALESRISQELALILDRTDVEEELNRFKGHLDHFRKILGEGGSAGRKLDFILQELNREINTLSNKAQDLIISEEAVQLKVRIEQLREQAMNIE